MMSLLRNTFLLILIALVTGSFATYRGSTLADYVMNYVKLKYHKPMANIIFVGANRQKLYLIKGGFLVKTYDVSTSRYGCGQENKSEKTPLGLHKIHSKNGKNVPLGGIIVGPNYNGKIAQIETKPVSTGQDDLTTRTIRLEGLEPGFNKGGNYDSFHREIYIHGTPEEGLIGKPASHGCVRMKNHDIVELFDQVNENFYVLILEN